MPLPGFLHLTWWEHPDDPTWFNEISLWTSKEALNDWHNATYHKYAKEWAAQGAIMEDIITNFELTNTRLLRVCPNCGHFQDKPYKLNEERKTLAQPCPECKFNFPVMEPTKNSNAVFAGSTVLCSTVIPSLALCLIDVGRSHLGLFERPTMRALPAPAMAPRRMFLASEKCKV